MNMVNDVETDTINAWADQVVIPEDDRPPSIPCAPVSLICSMRINQSGTLTLTAVVNGRELSKSVHVDVDYYCPEIFDYTRDPVALNAASKRTFPFGTPLPDGPVWFSGPYHRQTLIGQVGGSPFPRADYRPTFGEDFEGRLLWAPPPPTPPGVPISVVLFECRMSLKYNLLKEEHELMGTMEFLGKVDLYFYRPNIEH